MSTEIPHTADVLWILIIFCHMHKHDNHVIWMFINIRNNVHDIVFSVPSQNCMMHMTWHCPFNFSESVYLWLILTDVLLNVILSLLNSVQNVKCMSASTYEWKSIYFRNINSAIYHFLFTIGDCQSFNFQNW